MKKKALLIVPCCLQNKPGTNSTASDLFALGGAIGGAIGGGVQSALNGGSVGQITLGAISGGVQGYAIGSIIGGAQNVLAGAKHADAGFRYLSNVSGSTGELLASANNTIYVNGVGKSLPEAISQAKSFQALLFQNPSSGLGVDLSELAFQKSLGISSLGHDLFNVLSQANGPVTLISHSQGSQIVSNALFEMVLNGKRLAAGSEWFAYGSTANPMISGFIASLAGAKSTFPMLENEISYLIQPSLNPEKLARGLYGLTNIDKNHGFKNYQEIYGLN